MLSRMSRLCRADHMPTAFTASGDVDCHHSIHEHSSYLPDAAVVKCLESHGAHPIVEWQRDAEALNAEIDALQNPASCSKPAGSRPANKFHMLKLAEFGVGAVIKHFAKMLGAHWAMRQPVVVGNSRWRYSDIECGAGWSCQLAPLSQNCSLAKGEVPLSAVVAVDNNRMVNQWPTLDHYCLPHGKYDLSTGRCVCEEGYVQSQIERATDSPCMKKAGSRHEGEDTASAMYQAYAAPGEITSDAHPCPSRGQQHRLERKWGHMWYSGQVIHRLFAAAPLRERNRAFTAGLHLGKCIAMHVRHGDSCGDVIHKFKRVCQPLVAYARAARSMMRQYGKRQVFLATDDPHVVAQTKTRPFSDIDWVYQHIDRKKYDSSVIIDLRADMRSSAVADELFRDMYAMAQCDMLVGQFTSNIDRIVLEMIITKRGHYVPFVSLDAPWCDQTGTFRHNGQVYTC
eukprot:g5205.t1